MGQTLWLSLSVVQNAASGLLIRLTRYLRGIACLAVVVGVAACADLPNADPAPSDPAAAPVAPTVPSPSPLPDAPAAPMPVPSPPAPVLPDAHPVLTPSESLSSPPEPSPPIAQNEVIERGRASWYGDRFQGKRTASGERFDKNALTAAHKTLPFGTLVRVRSVRNGREVVVRINDRGPFVKGRVIDLSQAAMKALGLSQRGVIRVELLRE